MIEVRNLTKHYGPTRALDSVSFTVPTGQILGFLGPNGAGKTTAMKIITGYMPPTEGEVVVDSLDAIEQSLEVRRKIGYLPESTPLYTDMNVIDYLNFVQRLRGIPKSEHTTRNKRMIELCGLGEVVRKDIGELSKGYRQRVGLAQAMVHDPEILILDEPTVGLDPNQIVEIRNLIQTLGREKTLILCTHILPEVEAACRRVLIINRGRIVADGTTSELRAAASGRDRLTVEIKGPEGEVRQALEQVNGAARVAHADDGDRPPADTSTARFVVESAPGRDLRETIFTLVRDRSWILLEMRRDAVRLEDVFRQLTRDTQADREEASVS
ncbi:MAG: ATP-binding cassette domain-containing protein [candidate division Zixibacteria bacterium]|nr:ATP-binding cassette domain-containing protein [candidate division Zixibacteria bacterium]